MRTTSILSVYNQTPVLYKNILSMQKDLKRIADLGFKAIWINPIFSPCQVNPIPGMAHRIHCPYAMQTQTISPRFAANSEQVKDYTQAISDLNMVPIFDLVARHVAIDNELVTGDLTLKKNHNIDTSKWFKRHPNGNLMMHHMNDKFEPIGENPWCDIASFNYDDPVITDEIFTHFWEPFLKENIVDLGFKGLRLDAPLMIPPHVIQRLTATIKALLKNSCSGSAEDFIVIAETVGNGDENTILALKECGITHPMNSIYWMPGPLGTHEHDYSLWHSDKNWFAHNKGLLQQLGPTLGYAGSHDEPRYIEELLVKGVPNDKELLAFYMREKMAVTAFGSDGGWILSYGDEFGAHEKVNLFDTTPKEYHSHKELQRYDLGNFIQALNHTLQHLPAPIFPQWQQRVFLKSFPDVVIFITHQGEGYSGSCYLVIANPSEKTNFTLSQEIIDEIMNANGRNEKQLLSPHSIYLCGNKFDIKPESILLPVYHCTSQGKKVLFNPHSNKNNTFSTVQKNTVFASSMFKADRNFPNERPDCSTHSKFTCPEPLKFSRSLSTG
ncbi:MAG: alpha-amylase [Legionella sp.]|nr:alpha-amylase [Legionella sp.]